MRRSPVVSTPRAWHVALVLGAVYLFWGSTAPAMKLAIGTLPPFAMVTVRFALGGAILWCVARVRHAPLPRRREWPTSLLTGATLLVASNAVFARSLETMPSGVGALFFALSPLWMAIVAAVLDRERIAPLAAVGLALGFGGMATIVAPGSGSLPPVGVAVDTFCSVAWALGSIVQRRFFSSDLVQTSAMQMLLAAPLTLVLSLATGERVDLAHVSSTSLAALAYLVVFGSVVGFSAYLWLMRNVPTTLASTYAYVNPVVSIAIGATLLHESLTPRLAIGALVVVVGVALMMAAPRPRPALARAA